MPVSAGVWAKKLLKAARPPAEAPMPTTKTGDCLSDTLTWPPMSTLAGANLGVTRFLAVERLRVGKLAVHRERHDDQPVVAVASDDHRLGQRIVASAPELPDELCCRYSHVRTSYRNCVTYEQLPDPPMVARAPRRSVAGIDY